MKEFEVQDDLVLLVLKTKLGFKDQDLEKELLIEIEELCNGYVWKEQHPGIDKERVSEVLAEGRGLIID